MDGSVITPESLKLLILKVIADAEAGIYTITDHLFTIIIVGGIVFMYVSLDNSIRANNNGHPLTGRLLAICEIVAECLKQIGQDCVIFFSEACRPSVGMTWPDMIEIISDKCKIKHLKSYPNNDEANGLAFGVAVFTTNPSIVKEVHPVRISTAGYGSAAMGVALHTGEIVWGIHFPVDLFRIGADNFQYRRGEGDEHSIPDVRRRSTRPWQDW